MPPERRTTITKVADDAAAPRRPTAQSPRTGYAAPLAVPALTVALCVVFGSLRGQFFTAQNWWDILANSALPAIVAVGLAVCLALNEFDLSIAAVASFTTMLVSVLAVNHNLQTASAVPLTLEAWAAHQDINLRAALLCSQHAARAMIAAGLRGCIVNLSSIAATSAVAHNCAYGVAKAGLEALTRYLALELGTHDIRAVTVAPGPVRTPMTEAAFGSGLADTLTARMALKRVAEPTDIAEAVYWLSSPAATFVDGTTVYVDGGYSAG